MFEIKFEILLRLFTSRCSKMHRTRQTVASVSNLLPLAPLSSTGVKCQLHEIFFERNTKYFWKKNEIFLKEILNIFERDTKYFESNMNYFVKKCENFLKETKRFLHGKDLWIVTKKKNWKNSNMIVQQWNLSMHPWKWYSYNMSVKRD